MATLNLAFDVPTGHVGPLRAYLDSRYAEAIEGMSDEQAMEYHIVLLTVPGYQQWRRANDATVATAKATLATNEATRSAARVVDEASLASAQASASAAAAAGIAGLS